MSRLQHSRQAVRLCTTLIKSSAAIPIYGRILSRQFSSNKTLQNELKDVRTMMDLSNRNYIVTGGGQGIGYAITEAIAQMGGNVAVMDVRSEPVESFSTLASRFNVKTEYFQTDVTKESSLNSSFEKAITSFGSLDGLVPAAGIVIDKPFVEQTWDEVNRIQQVNVSQQC